MNRKIKWGCIQPLTGGMYLGAENAIGHPADWIISYPGLTDIKKTKKGTISNVGNEYNLLMYLKKHNRLPKYKVFNKKPFINNDINEVELIDVEGWSTGDINLENTDIVVSVPVCSGLSQATIAKDDTKDERNCNMIWKAKFALGVVKPKVYIFENAPLLFSGNSAQHVRETLIDIANNYGYSLIFYKTDTKLHFNCQRRPRTFVIFVKGQGAPEMLYENMPIDLVEYMEKLDKNSSQQECVNMNSIDVVLYDYIKYKYGENYRETSYHWTLDNIIKNNLWEDFYNYVDNYDCSEDVKEKVKHLCDHVQYKLSLGKNFYVLVPSITNKNSKTIPACMFKTIPTLIHYNEDRLYTIREWLHLMGHPSDFELYGDINVNYPKIGQNVPVRTAQWIVSEAVRLISNWDSLDRNNKNVRYFDNTKKCEVC